MMVYSSSQRMASQPSTRSPPARPGSARISSFSHGDENDSLKPPRRAHTFQNGSPVAKDAAIAEAPGAPDAFETAENTDTEDGIEITRASIELDVLPIELITLTDRYVGKPPSTRAYI